MAYCRSFEGARVAAGCLLLASALFFAPALAQPHRFDGVERVVAIGDVHGAYSEFVEVLQGTGLVDASLHWRAGKTHLVSTGDLLDRGDRASDVVALLMRLQGEATAAGGAVHVLLGNHEVMSLTGDLRYVSAAEFASYALQGDAASGHARRLRAFAPDGPVGRWLLQQPMVIVINGDAFLHGGLSERVAGMSLDEINQAAVRDTRAFAEGWHALLAAGALQPGDDFDRILEVARSLAAPTPQGSPPSPLQAPAAAIVAAVKGLPFVPDGPVWYRGNALCHPYAEAPVLDATLAGIGAQRVVIGHTPTLDRRIASRVDGRVVRIDTGMNPTAYKGRGSALVIERGRTTAFYLREDPAPLRAEANREWQRPYQMSDAQIEDFLLNAPITHTEELTLGVTRPKRLTLERDGQRMRAVFKVFDTDPGAQRGTWGRVKDAADRHVYEIAAYKLDRLLGLEMVPVVVLREVDGEQGVVQYWIEDAFNETDRVQKQLGYHGECRLAKQRNLMSVFDVLIHNVDRNTGNILYDREWQLWSIDHSRSFGTGRGRPPPLAKAAITVSAPMSLALARVTRENLKPLEPYLHRRQLQSLVERAQALRSAR